MKQSKPENSVASKLRATAIGKSRAVKTAMLGRITVKVVEDDHQFRGCRQSCIFGEIDECPCLPEDSCKCVGNDGNHVSGKNVWFKRVEPEGTVRMGEAVAASKEANHD